MPLGHNVDPDLFLSISGPGVIGSLLRRPTPDNLLRHYARGHIDFHGADIHTFIEALNVRNSRKRARKIRKSVLVRSLLPFLFEPASSSVIIKINLPKRNMIINFHLGLRHTNLILYLIVKV